VPEYWLVDLDEHVVEQWLLRGDDYALAGTFADLVTPACAPTVAIALAKVW
jgi:Uma2 family endonuclease